MHSSLRYLFSANRGESRGSANEIKVGGLRVIPVGSVQAIPRVESNRAKAPQVRRNKARSAAPAKLRVTPSQENRSPERATDGGQSGQAQQIPLFSPLPSPRGGFGIESRDPPGASLARSGLYSVVAFGALPHSGLKAVLSKVHHLADAKRIP